MLNTRISRVRALLGVIIQCLVCICSLWIGPQYDPSVTVEAVHFSSNGHKVNLIVVWMCSSTTTTFEWISSFLSG